MCRSTGDRRCLSAGRLSDKVSSELGKMYFHRRVFLFSAKIGGNNE